MRRLAGLTALLLIASALGTGCGGGNEPLRIAPGTDTRSEQEKESDAMLEKSRQDYNKRVR